MSDFVNYLRPRQAAQRLNVSDRYLSDLLGAGKLRFLLTPLGRIVDADDVERLRAERLQRRGARCARGVMSSAVARAEP